MDDAITSTSWWTNHDLQKSYTAFSAKVEAEMPRMAVSKGAKYLDSYSAEMSKWRQDIRRPAPGAFSRGLR